MNTPVAGSIAALALLLATALIVGARRRRASGAASPDAHDGSVTPAATAPATASSGPPPGHMPPDDGAAVAIALHRLALSAPQLAPGIPPGHEHVATQVARDLASSTAQASFLPRRPLLLPQLLRAINDSDTSRRELASIIARDPALAGDLLRLANSPYYRITEKPIESIDRAVAVLGTDGLRKLVASAVLQPVFRIRTGHFARFPETTWEHAFRAGVAAETFAALVDDSDPFTAQLLALLVGLGTIVVFRVAMDRYVAQGGLAPSPDLIAHLIDTHAASVAHAIASQWELSPAVLAALGEQSPGARADDTSALGRSVRFGRLTGALAVLRAAGTLTDEAALLAAGAPPRQGERIWHRLFPAA
ncbi:MAG: HDOD domain-containing protein [Steroidobacteraceae bacterium]